MWDRAKVCVRSKGKGFSTNCFRNAFFTKHYEKSQERLIEITADGNIDDDEIKDFVFIQQELERISITVETLQLWVEQMLADGKINIEKYNEIKGLSD